MYDLNTPFPNYAQLIEKKVVTRNSKKETFNIDVEAERKLIFSIVVCTTVFLKIIRIKKILELGFRIS